MAEGLEVFKKVLADGSTVKLKGAKGFVKVYVLAEDQVVGPVEAAVYVTRGSHTLLNDKLLSRLASC